MRKKFSRYYDLVERTERQIYQSTCRGLAAALIHPGIKGTIKLRNTIPKLTYNNLDAPARHEIQQAGNYGDFPNSPNYADSEEDGLNLTYYPTVRTVQARRELASPTIDCRSTHLPPLEDGTRSQRK